VFGPCFSGLDVQECSALETHYPSVPCGDGEHSLGLLKPMPFALGTTRHLSCAQLLFELHGADFRHEILPITVPIVDVPTQREVADDAVIARRASSGAVEQVSLGTAPNEAAVKSKPKKKSDGKAVADAKKVPGKGGAAKGKAPATKSKR
jgi:hypothetical protein